MLWRCLICTVVALGAGMARGAADAGVMTLDADDGKYQITLDYSQTPELAEWARVELSPVVREWYPRIVQMLPSKGFEAPQKFSITFHKDMGGVANTVGTRVNCAAKWFGQNLKGEAKGAVVHEMVHVVQQYGLAGRTNRHPQRNPGWLVEGLADYIRWFKYEPQSHGAEIRGRAIAGARFDAGYRTSANFLNYVSDKHGKEVIEQLNAAMRQGEYRVEIWQKLTGKSVEDLAGEWKKDLEKKQESAKP